MSGKRDLGVYVEDMIEACEHIILFAQGESDAALMDVAEPTRGAIMHHLMIMGEATKQLPQEWLALPVHSMEEDCRDA
ncbi:MAG: hypothetical protein CVT60_07545 [Actinobacteria bacterium HGW-Actinobacteria-10]|nr:MAG: hypothetical protein CVT60_07545 [Actinobacteria bacterium HGW-Actinobacteria-10]